MPGGFRPCPSSSGAATCHPCNFVFLPPAEPWAPGQRPAVYSAVGEVERGRRRLSGPPGLAHALGAGPHPLALVLSWRRAAGFWSGVDVKILRIRRGVARRRDHVGAWCQTKIQFLAWDLEVCSCLTGAGGGSKCNF